MGLSLGGFAERRDLVNTSGVAGCCFGCLYFAAVVVYVTNELVSMQFEQTSSGLIRADVDDGCDLRCRHRAVLEECVKDSEALRSFAGCRACFARRFWVRFAGSTGPVEPVEQIGWCVAAAVARWTFHVVVFLS